MSKFFLFCVAFLALIASSAQGQDVNVRYDSDADFSRFKTYKWVTLKNAGALIDYLMDEQIKAALDAALALKGLSKIDGDSSARWNCGRILPKAPSSTSTSLNQMLFLCFKTGGSRGRNG